MKYTTTKVINHNWSEYDKTVANCQLANYGVIFLDEYDCPIDDDYELEDLYNDYLDDFS